MQQYPSIVSSKEAPLGVPCVAFYKYDGSNLRWEWSPKRGWFKFGTKTHLFDTTDSQFSKAIPIFLNTMADEIARRVQADNKGIQRITVFTEYFGPNSFAGQHVDSDDMQLRLIDAYLFKKGLLNPGTFGKLFGDLPYSAEVIFRGILDQQFIDDVRAGRYPVWEGVVAKGEFGMVKIKTEAYFKKLFEVYGRNYSKYWE